jgi:hypothetical protein
MRDEAKQLWARARACRVSAQETSDEAAKKLMSKTAEELEAEARKVEAETPEPS